MENDSDNNEKLEEKLLLNKVPIHNKLKIKKLKKRRRSNNVFFPEPEVIISDNSQSNEEEILQLKEPEQKIKLIERAVGYFNAETDDETTKNPLNLSTNEGPPFICIFCTSWFYIGPKLKVHYLVNHNCYHCDICSCLFQTLDEKQMHVSQFHSSVFCEICQINIPDFSTLLQHYELEHDCTTCKFCGILLQPKAMLNSHVTRKHGVKGQYASNECTKFFDRDHKDELGLHFICNLCGKQRELDVFFGHFHSHHKISLTSLMNMIVNENNDITINGTNLNGKTNAQECEKTDRNTCYVCSNMYSKKIPASFHQIYCMSKIPCKFCDKNFANNTFRERHVNKVHSKKFSCVFKCVELYYENLEQLNTHYFKFHEKISCRYCDEFVDSNNENYMQHLSENHKYQAVMMKNFTDTLFEITKDSEKHIVTCCLCDENITNLVENIPEIFGHFVSNHLISHSRILRLLGSKPVLKEYDDFYHEINESIKKELNIENDSTTKKKVAKIKIKIKSECTSSDDDDEEEAENIVENNAEIKDDENSETVNFTESDIESDFDHEETETLLNLDSDSEYEESEINCEICGEESSRLLTLITHLKDKHKIKVDYKEIKCKYCKDIYFTYSSYEQHIKTCQENKNNIPTEKFNCNCDNNNKVVIHLARKHILQIHYDQLQSFDVNTSGIKCRFCDHSFWQRDTLNEHEVENHFQDNQNEFYKCFKCLTPFSSQSCLKSHIISHHTDSPNYTTLTYKCIHCTILFPQIDLLRQHFREEHSDLKVYRCPIPNCYKTCKQVKYIMRHIKTPHTENDGKNEKKIEPPPCKVCGKIFKTFRALSIHTMMKHERERAGFSCRICKERFESTEQRKLHYTTAHPGELAYTCPECGKGFISKSGLYGHRKIHQQSPVNVCPYCKKEFSRRDSYNEHLLIHIGPRHQCPHCPKSFTQRSNLTRHVRIHTGAKPYQCTYCEKKFSDRGACRSHERVHTKEEHCECSYCGKKFTKKQKLKYHIKFHTGEGLVECEVCGKQFSNTYSLNEHRKTHNQETLVMCNCGRGFSSEKYLQRHIMNVHTPGAARFSCPICFKPLFNRTSFNDHIMTHTKIKHVRCLLCNKESSTRKTIKRHLQEKHNIALPEEIKKYILELKPEEIGLNIPSASNMTINLKELLDDSNLVKIKDEPISENENENETYEEKIDEETLDEVPLVSRTKRKVKQPVKCKRKVKDDVKNSTITQEN